MRAKGGRRYREAAAKVDHDREYAASEAIGVVKSLPDAKFDETVEVAFRLGVDPRKADQMVRGTVSLPHGSGKSVRVAAFAVGEKAREGDGKNRGDGEAGAAHGSLIPKAGAAVISPGGLGRFLLTSPTQTSPTPECWG